MEEKKAGRILFGLSSSREKDTISKLPDSLISQILWYLPTKEAVRTSVLSNRWKSLWLLIPGLDLKSYEFSDYNAFASFIDRCLDFYKEENSCLHKLKLSLHKHESDTDLSSVTSWIDFVAKTRKLKHLDVECFAKPECLQVMPVSLFFCESLLFLRLHKVLVGCSFEDSSSVSLPRLKTMRLERNKYANEKSLETLISSCPVLEDLSIERRFNDNVKVLRVRSQTLTSLSIKFYCVRSDNEELGTVVVNDVDLIRQLGVLIDAPRLEYLNFFDAASVSKTIRNSGSLAKVNLHAKLEGSVDEVRKFFASFSRVKDLEISIGTFLYIQDSVLPQFCNLSSLKVEICSSHVENLPTLLASCPNLRSLVLDFVIDIYVREQMGVSSAPLSFLSSLEFVEIKCHCCGHAPVELVRYFTENSMILKKLVLRLRDSTIEENAVILRALLALPRRSSSCQIIVC